jgi:redox-sensitive bicupin YhaK (pirin superfamily)
VLTGSFVRIKPDQRGHKPNYGSRRYTIEDRRNRMLQMLGPASAPSAEGDPVVRIHQDANVFVTEIDAGVTVPFVLRPLRQLYVVCAEGAAALAGTAEALDTRDGMEIENRDPAAAQTVQFAAGPTGAHLMLVEMALAP